MLDGDNGTLRRVAWSEIFPWLSIFRTFRLAISLRVLVLAAVAILLTATGWGLFGWMFSGDPAAARATKWTEPYQHCPWEAVTRVVPDQPNLPGLWEPVKARDLPALVSPGKDPLFGSWAQLSRPLWAAFDLRVNVSGLVCLVLCGLWSLAIWAFFGGAIARIAAVQLACEERVGWGAALRHACRKWLSYFSAPLFPLIGVLLAAIPALALGVLLRLDFGILLAAVAWPLLLAAGWLMAILLLGLIFGWPLMWGTISVEGTDSFDALSRSYAYVFQRPLHYLFYAVVAAAFGVLGWLLVSNFAAAVVGLTYWAAGWTAGWDTLAEHAVPRMQLIVDGDHSLGAVGGAGAVLIHFWVGCVKLLAAGFPYGYFWIASTAIYVLLRRNVDATEMDEVFLDKDASEETYGVPPLTTDASGAPAAADGVAGSEEPDEENGSAT